MSTIPPAHEEARPEPVPDEEENSDEATTKKRPFLGRMWSKVAMGKLRVI